MKPKFKTIRHLHLAAIVISFAGVIQSAQAASDTWNNGGGDNQWQTFTNWVSNTQFPGAVSGFTSTDDATFSATGATGTIDLGGTINIRSLIFGESGGDAALFAIGDAGDVLNFTTAGGITVNTGVTTAQTIGVTGTTLNLSTAAAASTAFTHNGSGLLTIAGNVTALNASGAGVLNVGGSGNTTITGTVTEPGVGNQALKKVGSGTLTLSNGSSWSGAGASQSFGTGTNGNSPITAPTIIQEGVLLLNGGTHTVNGETIIGGITSQGGAGQNAKVQVDAGTLTCTNWLSVGRGNGIGVASSDLVLNNNAIVTAVDMSGGYNGGNAANLPKALITLNGTSSLSVNNTVNIAESAGSNVTLNINNTASFAQTANVAQTRVGMADGAVGVINQNGGTASFHRDFILGSGGTGSGKLVINSGTFNMSTTVERWLKLNDSASAGTGRIDVEGGNLNLNTNTDLRFSTNAGASGTNVVNLNAGAITGHTGNNNGVFSGTSEVDLNQGSNQAGVNNTFNLNGGTLTIGRILTGNNSGIAAFNFNGGALRAAAASTTFLDLGGANQRVNVRNGGAIINTNGFDVTVVDALLHSNVGGDAAIDGGLTKNGAGILTLNGANTYTGTTTINSGTLLFGGGVTGSLTGAIVNNDALIFNRTGDLTQSGNISGSGSITNNGTGVVTLSGTNTYNGATTINTGVLTFLNTAAKSASSAVSVAAGAGLGLGVGGAGFFSSADVDSLFANTMAGVTMDVASLVGVDTTAGDFTYATGQSGTRGLVKLGTGTLVLPGNHSYSGPTRVSAGTLVLSGSNTTTGATTISGGTLEIRNAPAMSSTSALTIATGGTLSLRADADTTFTPASVTGSAGASTIAVNQLTGAGAGKTLTLANPYTAGATGSSLTVSSTSGDTLLLSSQLNMFNASAPATTINLSGANMTLNAGVNFNGATNGPLLTVNANSNTLLINGNYTTGGNRWAGIALNNGTLTLANGQNGGSSTNNGLYAVLNGGTLNLNNANAIGGAVAGNNFTINGGTLDNTSGSTKTLSKNPVTTINGDFAFSTSGGTSANDLSLGTNTVSLGTAVGTTRTITTNGSAKLTLGGAIGNGTTANSLTKAGTGTLLLKGINTYSGATTVTNGTLALESGSQASPITVDNGASLGFTLGAGTTSSSTVTLSTGSTVKITGTPTLPSYTLMAASSVSGTPVLASPIAGYSLVVTGGNTLMLTQSAGFESWASSKGLDGTAGQENGAMDDPNHNGIPNVLEYVLNGEPLLGESPAAILPTLNATGVNFVFTFTRRVESADDTTQIFEYGTNLSGWTPLNITTPTDGAVTLGTPTGGDPNLQTVTVTVAKGGNTKMFGRLKAVK